MDTVTQMALGATIAEAGFRRKLGGRSLLFGAACGLLPDLDMVTRLAGGWATLVHHRGMSHSLPVLAALTPLVGWAGYRLFRARTPGAGQGTYWQWTHLAFWALLTHPVLDWFTSYGTQLLAPFSRHRFAMDGVSIIDLFYTLPLLAVLGWAFATRRRPQTTRQRWVAAGVLVLTTAYLGLGTWMSHWTASRARDQLASQGFGATHVRAIPTLFVHGLYRVVARDRDGHLRVGFASGWAPRRIRFQRLDRPKDQLVQKALASPRGRLFRWFADGYLDARVVTQQGNRVVVLRDMRFGFISRVDKVIFTARVVFDRRGEITAARRGRRPPGIGFGQELAAFWRRLTGG